MDILQFSKIVSSQHAAYNYLRKLRWPNGIICPYCSSNSVVTYKKRYNCLRCNNRFSLTSGTYLAWCKLKPNVIISIVKLFVLGLSSLEASKELNLNYKTALSFFDTIRLAIFQFNIDEKNPLSGEVEMDETYIGGKKHGK